LKGVDSGGDEEEGREVNVTTLVELLLRAVLPGSVVTQSPPSSSQTNQRAEQSPPRQSCCRLLFPDAKEPLFLILLRPDQKISSFGLLLP
jgi:hypothetical protein